MQSRSSTNTILAMPIRPANTVTIIKRQLDQFERGEPDPMELVGLHDELSRLERKWLMQIAEGSDRRQPNDPQKLDAWFKRLQLLIERSLRATRDPTLKGLLEQTLAKIKSR